MLQGMGREAIANYIHPSKYARYLPTERRRETYPETVVRVRDMHLRRYPTLEKDIYWVFDEFVAQRRILPSMRSMQFGGKAIEANNCRLYNCSFSLIDRPRAFAEGFYLLLCGCGVGFSVQRQHVSQIPPLARIIRSDRRLFVIPDSIQGWAEAMDMLVMSYFEGYVVEFDYSLIRKEGEPLLTSGGRAPGPKPLERALERIRAILDAAQGRQMRPVEAYDIMCHGADAVLSGGIRRSAMIALFSPDDEEMLLAKTGDWYHHHPWRARSNNSAALLRQTATWEQYQGIFEYTKQWGEPGVYFLTDLNYGSNPCVEIGMNPKLSVSRALLSRVREQYPRARVGDEVTGWSFCNLTEMNAAMFGHRDEMLEATRAAAILGTLQAGYTDFPFLGPVSELICRREALLGVSMTGMMDSPEVSFDSGNQRDASQLAVDTNREFAERIGIRPAARVTCIKPSGTASLALGCIGSGIHTHHARQYFRRIVANRLEPVYQYFKSVNPHMCERLDETNDIITFCVEAPENAITRKDLSAVEFLQKVMSTQENWVLPGTSRPNSSPGLTHNVSNTVSVQEGEWDDVKRTIWDHRSLFTGVALLPEYGDKAYDNAPREAVTSDTDRVLWDFYVQNYTPVDYTKMVEMEDGTCLTGEIACGGGHCDL